MPNDETILKTYFDGVTKRIQAEIDYVNSLIGHAGETGRANEKILVDLLVKFLPKQYSIGSGIVIDRNGGRSKQVDVIVYDSYFHPELFAQGSTVLYPVDTVYLACEVKTVLNKQTTQEAIENIASVKRLRFIESQVVGWKHPEPGTGTAASSTVQKTSPPLGVIFGFKTDTVNFNTYAPWLEPINHMPQNEIFDLIYSLNTTFFHVFEDLTGKKQISKGMYCRLRSGRCIEAEKSGVYRDEEDGQTYPVIEAGEKRYVVDPARGFLNFLSAVNDMLALKQITRTSIMKAYLTKEMSNAFMFD
jgi:hypothetical protein